MSNIYYRKFVYSRQQQDDKVKIESQHGTTPRFGKVQVNGIMKTYTEMLSPSRQSRYADAIVLIEGDIRKINYEEPPIY